MFPVFRAVGGIGGKSVDGVGGEFLPPCEAQAEYQAREWRQRND